MKRGGECGGTAFDIHRDCVEPPRGTESRNLRRIRAWSNVYVGCERARARARSLSVRRRLSAADQEQQVDARQRKKKKSLLSSVRSLRSLCGGGGAKSCWRFTPSCRRRLRRPSHAQPGGRRTTAARKRAASTYRRCRRRR